MLYTSNQIREATSDAAAADMIRHNLTHCDRWLVRGLLAVFNHQTNDEQNAEHTRYRNNVGFNSADGHKLTSFAKQVLRWMGTPKADRKYRTPLSPRQFRVLRERLPKYAGQLARIAREREPVAA